MADLDQDAKTSLIARIHAAAPIEGLLPHLGRDVCDLLHAQRLTLYVPDEEDSAISSIFQMGLESFKPIRLAIAETSLAGYVALIHRPLNIADPYDAQELKRHSPRLSFLKTVDERTGFRSRQMLVAPVLGPAGEMLGVLQLVNHVEARPFSASEEAALIEIAQSFAKPLMERRRRIPSSVSKFEYLVIDRVIALGELKLAARAARRKNKSLEDVLIDEFQVKISQVGGALAKYFGVDYEPHISDRVKPADLLKNITRDYAEENHWLVVEESKAGVVVISTDPGRVKNSRMVDSVFPHAEVVYRVTTERDFKLTLDLFFGADSQGDVGSESIGCLLASFEDSELESSPADDVSAAADNELAKLVNKIIVDAYNQGASDIHIEPSRGRGKTTIRLRKDGELSSYLEIPHSYRNALTARLKIMSGLDVSERAKPQAGRLRFKGFGPIDVDLSVATVPASAGLEGITLKIVDPQSRGGEPAIPVPLADDVYFTVTAPQTVAIGKGFVLDVWAHLEDERKAVLAQAAEEAAGKAIRSKTKGVAKVEHGKVLTVRVSIPDFGFSEMDSILWTGTTGNATFAVTVPERTEPGAHIGTVTFAVDGLRISRLHFELDVGDREGAVGRRRSHERRPESAFASYASEDRDRVLGRIQGMQKLLPDLSIFIDIASIRSGENWATRLEEEIARRDLFYLFWSVAASRSEWVEKEWRAALRLKGIENIDPVPLEPPQKAPPPVELQSLHFNEWTLAFQGG